MKNIWTIGHSNHSWERFAALLDAANINTLIDVRSHPRSRFSHFNRQELERRLSTINVEYVYFGAQLGGLNREGLEYERLARCAGFKRALQTVSELAERSRSALMCSEHEPLTCHRGLLLGRKLAEEGVVVEHILRDGTIEKHKSTEDRLLAQLQRKSPNPPTLRSEQLREAYRLQEERLR